MITMMAVLLYAMAVIILLLFGAPGVQAACTETLGYVGGDVWKLTLAWTANANGSFDDDTTAVDLKGYILEVVTVPDSTAGGDYPNDNYDVTLTTELGDDIMGGAIANRDTTSTERAQPLSESDNEVTPVIDGTLILDVTGNTVNGAKGSVIIYWIKRD